MSIRGTVRKRLEPYARLAVWGAGGMGRNAMERWLPREKVVAVIDSNAGKAGGRLGTVPIAAPSSLADLRPDCIVICTHAHMQVRASLAAAASNIPVFYIYELFLPDGGWQEMSPLQQLQVDVAATKNAAWPIFLLQKPQILVNATFRAAQWAQASWLTFPLYVLLYVLHYLTCIVFSIQLPLETRIGPGLIFAHYGTIVFTGRARIGSFFTIYHGCTVGTDSSGTGPVIDDFVTQFAGSHVLGACKLGKNVRVGANAVVLGLVAPDNASVVGVPARVVPQRAES